MIFSDVLCECDHATLDLYLDLNTKAYKENLMLKRKRKSMEDTPEPSIDKKKGKKFIWLDSETRNERITKEGTKKYIKEGMEQFVEEDNYLHERDTKNLMKGHFYGG